MIETLAWMRDELNRTAHLRRIGRLFSETILLQVDASEYYLVFDRGELADIVEGPSRKTPYRFGLVTDSAALAEFWKDRPSPGFHDLFGLVKIGRCHIEGDILTLVKNLRFVKELLALPRGNQGRMAR